MKNPLLHTVFLTVLICAISVYVFITGNNKKITATSPLPNFLTILENKQASTLDLWTPNSSAFSKDTSSGPNISARSALVYDITTGKLLYSKNSLEKLPMASLTKIMTAVLALENKKEDNKYIVLKADLVGEDSMGLSEGEVLKLEELLYGLMLNSGNDAAEVLANNFPGGRNSFIKAMNDKAKSLGLTDTHFTNPTGLEGDGRQYTTAYDLLVMANYALKFDTLKKVVSTFDYDIPATLTHKEFFLENETNLLTSYPGVKGIKTGYTPEAGLCLVTYLKYGGHQLIGVILGSDNRRAEMKELLDYSLKSESLKPPPHS